MLRIAIVFVCLVSIGCASPDSQADASTNVCDDAARVVADCTGAEPIPPASCDDQSAAAAQSVVDGGCEGLQDSKSDSGFWCSAWVRWMGLCDTAEESSTNIEHIGALADAAAANGRYVGVADAHGALAVDPAGEPCEVTIDAQSQSFTVLVDAFGVTDAFVLDEAPDRVVASFEQHTDDFADGSGRQFHTTSVMVDTGEGTDLFTTQLTMVRFDNGNRTVSVVQDDTPMSSCTFRAN